MKTISNLPPKGTSDWFPEEFRVRKYIFDTWRAVCLSYGYLEYLTPIIESAEVYKAKSGEDIGGKELMSFQDRAGRELAIRPEMTPSVTRMLSRIYGGIQKPVRLFSIANYFRNEKPQRGRNREFWQLNFDLFGSNALTADLEILQMSLEIMLAFNPPKGAFTLHLNSRKLIDDVFRVIGISPENSQQLSRILDKYSKLSVADFTNTLEAELKLSPDQVTALVNFLEADSEDLLLEKIPALKDSVGLSEIKELLIKIEELGYSSWVDFRPNVIRGFDYYDGMIFEVFDNNPLNLRSMFGGGRYNGLAKIFGIDDLPAVGVAPGDETTKLFLEAWNLTPNILEETKPVIYYFPILVDSAQSPIFSLKYMQLARKLRSEGIKIEQGLELQTISKALQYSNKKAVAKMVILGSQELAENSYKLKDMVSGEEVKLGL